MPDAYSDAFARFLRTGAPGSLAEFLAPGAEPGRLAVYRNGFFKSCGDALRSNYPSVERLVGEACFGALARGYVEAHPPRVATLVEYGEDFPAFVAAAVDAHGLDYLASVATLDRAWTEAWFAAEPAPPDPATLARLAGDAQALLGQRGGLAPCARLVSLDHAVLEAWRALRRDALHGPREVRRSDQHVLVWRAGDEVSGRDLAPAEHAFVAALAAGRTCADAAQAAIDLDEGLDLAGTFAALLQHRIVTLNAPGAAP